MARVVINNDELVLAGRSQLLRLWYYFKHFHSNRIFPSIYSDLIQRRETAWKCAV